LLSNSPLEFNIDVSFDTSATKCYLCQCRACLNARCWQNTEFIKWLNALSILSNAAQFLNDAISKASP